MHHAAGNEALTKERRKKKPARDVADRQELIRTAVYPCVVSSGAMALGIWSRKRAGAKNGWLYRHQMAAGRVLVGPISWEAMM